MEDVSNKDRRRKWCFTLNNPENHPAIMWNEDLRCWCYQYEIGEKGTPHYQGYFEIKKPVRLNWIKKNISKEMHLKIAFGDRKSNKHYCSKPHGPNDNCYDKCTEICLCKHCIDARKCQLKIADIIFGGNWNDLIKGEREDLTDFYNDIFNYNIPYKDLIEKHFSLMLKYNNVVTKWRNDYQSPPYEGLRSIILIIGDRKTGKSEMIHKETPYLVRLNDIKWWDGYNNDDKVAFQDFTGEISINDMMRYCDIYPEYVPKRYIGPVPFNAKEIYITSNSLPEHWYKNENVNRIAAFYRRFTAFIITRRNQKPYVTYCYRTFIDFVIGNNILPDYDINKSQNIMCLCNEDTCKDKQLVPY